MMVCSVKNIYERKVFFIRMFRREQHNKILLFKRRNTYSKTRNVRQRIQYYKQINEWIMMINTEDKPTPTTIIQVHMPTDIYSDEK